MNTTPPPPPPPPPSPPPPPPMNEGIGVPNVGGRELASAGMRLLVRFLDVIIVFFVFGSVFALMVLSGDSDGGIAGLGADATFGETYLLGFIGVVTSFLWDAVSTKQFGGSPMKVAFGMKVVQADSGADVEWEHAIKRWAVPGAFALIPPVVVLNLLTGLAQFAVVIVSLVFIFTKPMRQAVWDVFANTVVVKSR